MLKELLHGVVKRTQGSALNEDDRVELQLDRNGRLLTTPYQIRDLVATALASPTNQVETTLLAGVASTFHDLSEITCVNTTGSAVSVLLRDATGGGVVKRFQVPANDTISQRFPVPLIQNAAADTWTVQLSSSAVDASGLDNFISATFIKNV